ncbi:transposase [Streptomyces tendae]|uniref:transposase n=1 Tax=Streptomyces tendae TaxID=1932 RepID=UPI003721AEEE
MGGFPGFLRQCGVRMRERPGSLRRTPCPPHRGSGGPSAGSRTASHRTATFKLFTDPYVIDKAHDVVGLCLEPPERTLVFGADEMSQIQALDRSQPVLPMMPGAPQRITHDYVRAGTTTLFAALEAATGKVIGSLHRRYRAEDFKKFRIQLDQEIPVGLDAHLLLHNCATHKTPAIKTWLVSHPRFHLNITPTGSSWLNLVMRWSA